MLQQHVETLCNLLKVYNSLTFMSRGPTGFFMVNFFNPKPTTILSCPPFPDLIAYKRSHSNHRWLRGTRPCRMQVPRQCLDLVTRDRLLGWWNGDRKGGRFKYLWIFFHQYPWGFMIQFDVTYRDFLFGDFFYELFYGVKLTIKPTLKRISL